VLLVGLIAVPLVALGVFSLVASVNPLQHPTVDNYVQLFDTPLYIRILGRTVLVALAVTALAVVLGWPAGWIISRLSRRAQLMVLSLVVVPYLTSFLLLIYAMFVMLSPGGPVMSLLGVLHLADAGDSIVYTPWATFVMLVYESLPLVVLVMYSTSDRIPDTVVDAARSLGAGGWSVFRTIVAPQSLNGLVISATLVFIPVLGAFAESAILGGPGGLLYGNLINDQNNQLNDQPFAAALSFLLLATVLGVALGLGLLGRALARRHPAPEAS
jgi:spermidine/putrescine transport system permease protein